MIIRTISPWLIIDDYRRGVIFCEKKNVSAISFGEKTFSLRMESRNINDRNI